MIASMATNFYTCEYNYIVVSASINANVQNLCLQGFLNAASNVF